MNAHYLNSLLSAHVMFYSDRKNLVTTQRYGVLPAHPAFRSAGSDNILAVCSAWQKAFNAG